MATKTKVINKTKHMDWEKLNYTPRYPYFINVGGELLVIF